LYNFGYELTITGLLEIKLIGYLFLNGCHLLQQLRILIICTVGSYPASDYFHGRLREVGLREGQHLLRDRPLQMLHIRRQPTRGFLEAIHERCYLAAARMRHQEPCYGKRSFFKFLQLGPQRLAVLVQLLQRFLAVDEVTIGSNAKLHVLVTLEGKFLIVKLEYLAGLLLPVEEVLHVCL
jgi:hypothetical protein